MSNWMDYQDLTNGDAMAASLLIECDKLQAENEALRKRIEKLESELEDAAEPIVVLLKLEGLSQLERDILVKAEQVLYSEPLLNKQEYFNKFLGDGNEIK